MKHRINPAVLALLTTHWAMEPSALALMEHSLIRLPAGIDLSVKYAPKADWFTGPKTDWLDGEDDGDRTKPRKPYEMAGGLALIRLSGPLQKDPSWLMRYYGGTSTRAFIAMLALAEGDPDVSKILVLADSPGGDVDGTADAADAVYAVRMRAKKPIVAAVDGMCCSACYWIASQASRVYCGQTSVVGSIGTRWRLLDTSGYYEQLGIKPHEVTSGTYKAAGADGLPLKAEDVAYFQGIVDDMQGRFSAGVVRGRKLSADAVRLLAADAKIYVGKAALDAGLVDEILPVRDVIRQLQKGASATGTTASAGGKGTNMADKGFKARFLEAMARLGGDHDGDEDEMETSADPAVLMAQVRTLTAQNATLAGDKAVLTAQVETLTVEKGALAAQVETVTGEKETLKSEHATLTERVKGIDEAEATAQATALTEARTAALAAATTAFGADSPELANAQALIETMSNSGVLASMTSAYKAATPKQLRPGATRQTATSKVVTTDDKTPEQEKAEQKQADALDPDKVYGSRRGGK